MSERNYYVISDDNCRFESMTKEQILTAITEAVESHEISDVDTGFVTTLKEQNKNTGLKFWVGTQAQYNALETKESNCFYIITDEEDVIPAMMESIEEIQGKITTLEAFHEMKGVELYSGNIPYGYNVNIPVPNLEKYTIVAIVTGPNESISAEGLCYIARHFAEAQDYFIVGTIPSINIDEETNIHDSVNLNFQVINGIATIKNNFSIEVDNGNEVSQQTIYKIIGIM